MEMGSASERDKMPALIRKIISVQSFYRGHIVRKRLERIRSMLEGESDIVSGVFDETI